MARLRAAVKGRVWAGLVLFLPACAAGPVHGPGREPQSARPAYKVVAGEDYLSEVVPLLDSARTGIDILEFNFFSESGHVRELANQLVRLKSERPGLQIRVALEGEKDADKPQGAATRNKRTQALLAAGGIEVHLVHGLRQGAVAGVSHTKALCVDRKTVLAGSTNWTNTSIDKNNEMNVEATSDAVGKQFTEYFESVIAQPGVMHPFKLAEGPLTFLTDTTYYDQAVPLIRDAPSGTQLDLAMYFFAYRSDADVQPKALFDELVAAHARGVKIRVFLERNGDPTVAPDVTKANFRVAGLLNQAGITEVYFDPADKISHTKMVIFNDQAVLLGSTNWYRGDLDENHQINWLIRDETVARQTDEFYFGRKMAREGTPASSILPGL